MQPSNYFYLYIYCRITHVLTELEDMEKFRRVYNIDENKFDFKVMKTSWMYRSIKLVCFYCCMEAFDSK